MRECYRNSEKKRASITERLSINSDSSLQTLAREELSEARVSAMADRPRRRNAVRQRQLVEIKGHKFVLTYFKGFTFCGHCSRFLW